MSFKIKVKTLKKTLFSRKKDCLIVKAYFIVYNYYMYKNNLYLYKKEINISAKAKLSCIVYIKVASIHKDLTRLT